ncbi:MAG TPA: DEAD/DEAH box helicase [Acidimicrobiia bacterium]|nr:DEAD/DEAH box helicase [Acidimicrobiia bacterium]
MFLPVTFSDLGVSAELLSRLADQGVTEPFPIQEATIPPALAGRDVCGRAPTGSGKTLAFGIPLVTRVAKAKPSKPKALVLAPTRELAAQIERALTPLAATRQRRVAALYGGVGFGAQLAALRKGADIIVATPGRLADLIERKQADLCDVEIVVVDEADRMADMGFLPEVRRLLDRVRPDRQTFLFSATLDGEIDVLVRHYQREPFRHEVETPEGAEDLRRHLFWRAERTERAAVAAQVVARHPSTVVFCRTKRGADRLARQLTQAGLDVAAIHGDRSQKQREAALAAFSSGRVQALVATDVAARGIHVDAVGCVLHFDPPEDDKTYVHRSGRTGRAGAGGTVLSLVTAETAGAVRVLQKALGFPTRTTGPDLESLGAPVPRRRPAARPATAAAPSRPDPAAADDSRAAAPRADGTKPERNGRQWKTGAVLAQARRKPDGRPARGFGRRKAQSRRANPA